MFAITTKRYVILKPSNVNFENTLGFPGFFLMFLVVGSIGRTYILFRLHTNIKVLILCVYLNPISGIKVFALFSFE